MQITVNPAGTQPVGRGFFFSFLNVQAAVLLHVAGYWSQDWPRGSRTEGAHLLHGCASSSSPLLMLRTRELFPLHAPESATDL